MRKVPVVHMCVKTERSANRNRVWKNSTCSLKEALRTDLFYGSLLLNNHYHQQNDQSIHNMHGSSSELGSDLWYWNQSKGSASINGWELFWGDAQSNLRRVRVPQISSNTCQVHFLQEILRLKRNVGEQNSQIRNPAVILRPVCRNKAAAEAMCQNNACVHSQSRSLHRPPWQLSI